MADRDRDAEVAQPLDVLAFGDVRARYRVAEIGQHLRNAAHADAADADEMDRTDIARQFHGVPVKMDRDARHSAGRAWKDASTRGNPTAWRFCVLASPFSGEVLILTIRLP